MARGVNKVILLGNLGNDPDVKYTQSGVAICTLSLATSSVRKNKDGESVESVQWHRVKLFGKTAEVAGEYLAKGRQVYIEGRIEYGSYEKDGVKHYTTDIIGEDMQMLGGSGGGERGSEQDRSRFGGGSRREPSADGKPTAGAQQAQQRAKPAPASFDSVPFDDDIPFN